MRLLGAFFNIFAFYYFLAMCGSTGEPAQSVEQGVEAHAVQAREKIEEPGNAPLKSKKPSELDYLKIYTPGSVSEEAVEG